MVFRFHVPRRAEALASAVQRARRAWASAHAAGRSLRLKPARYGLMLLTRRLKPALCVALVLFLMGRATAQQPSRPPATPRSSAPADLTGYWVAVITEDWRFRMVTAPRGDAAGVPLNDAGQKAANAWDPQKDIAAGEQCRAFGAGGVMRMPIRLRVSWQDDTTLKFETDNGQQMRLFRFGALPAAASEPQWQGQSVASWETVAEGQGIAPAGGGGGGRGGGANPATQLSGSMKVVTTNMRPGYVRRNGVPYSGGAVLTEFFDRSDEANGDVWLIVTSTLDDPTYFAQPLMTSTHFKREPDGSKWNPRPCEVTLPLEPR
jgi:hypothetical protein